MHEFGFAPIVGYVERIGRDEKIELHYEDFPEDFDGFLAHTPRGWILTCNARRGPRHSPRSRYTIAHELGHYFISTDRARMQSGKWPVFLCSTETSTPELEEREADWFAANLVLPTLSVKSTCEDFDGTAIEHVLRLSRDFRVSATARAYRLLGLEILPAPAAILRWTRDLKPAGRRISEATLEGTFLYERLAFVPPPGSVTAKSCERIAVKAEYGRTPAEAWFPNLAQDLGKHPVLHEEVMNLHRHGFLTMING